MTAVEKLALLKKTALAELLETELGALSASCTPFLSHPDILDELLSRTLPRLPYSKLIYVTNAHGVQISANVRRDGADPHARGRDRSARPYFAGGLPYQGTLISHAYLDVGTTMPCVTAVHPVRSGGRPIGFVLADMLVKDLPSAGGLLPQASEWRQFKGDPAIRGTLFQQSRIQSTMDENLDQVFTIIHALVRDHGVFHFQLHFSSSRAILWQLDDPFSYWIHDIEEIIDPEVCVAYPRREYSDRASVSSADVPPILERFKGLRFADDTVYLRSASLNVMNGLIGLTFSCDGSHYMDASDFLRRGPAFWNGGEGLA